MNIGEKEYGNVFLAPMAGVTEVGFRTVCKMAGADLTYTEMVNANALMHNSNKTKDLLITNPIEKPVAVQIFGHDENIMAEVCASELLEKFDLIDINFGCPAPKIVKNGDGSALLNDLNKVYKIVSSCVKAANKPITCKFRIGFFKGQNVAKEMARVCEDAGAKMITVHGRTREQMYAGAVDYETIANVKSCVKIPVVGNGDVFDIDSYQIMLQTGVDGVLVGRGALGNPNIFAKLKGIAELNKIQLIEKHIEVLRQNYDEKFVSATMRKHLLWYISGEYNSNKIKLQVATAPLLDDAFRIVKSFLEDNKR